MRSMENLKVGFRIAVFVAKTYHINKKAAITKGNPFKGLLLIILSFYFTILGKFNHIRN